MKKISDNTNTPLVISALLLFTMSIFFVSCGPRYKTPKMVEFEGLIQTPLIEKLKKSCPDLINDAVSYYTKAKELHEDNEPEESEYYVTLAKITWKTAERRAGYLTYRAQMANERARFERAQTLLTDSIQRRKNLLKMKGDQQNKLKNDAIRAQNAQNMQKKQRAEEVKRMVEEAKLEKMKAEKMGAPEFATGPFKKGMVALQSSESAVQRGDLLNAKRIAQGAIADFKVAKELARPFFDKEKEKKSLKKRMQTLAREAGQIDNGNAAIEARGVVLTISGLYRNGKMRRNQDHVFDQLAALINRYADLRIIVEGHTNAYGNQKKKLARTERMASEVMSIIRSKVGRSELKISALGRGDYAPLTRNTRSMKNERIDVVFFKPRLK